MKLIIISSLLVTVFCSPLQSIANTAASCGVPAVKPDISSNIAGGKDAIPYSWPWQVAVHYPANYTPGYPVTNEGYFGASLISNQWIMTSALNLEVYPHANYTAKLGVLNKNKDNEVGEQIITVAEVHVHPKFDEFSLTYDIALLKLSRPVQYTDHISPICLPSKDEVVPDAGTTVFLAGWGSVNRDGGDTDTLRQVNIPIVSEEKCKQKNGDRVAERILFCAGVDEGGKGQCFDGDLGDPLVIQDQKTGTWKQIGIASYGNGYLCAPRGYPYPMFSKVSALLDFINEKVGNLGTGSHY